MVSAGAKILGSITIGDDSKIGAGSVVLKDVPSNSTVVGIPGRVVKRNDEKVHPRFLLDQVHLPDPVRMEMCKVILRLENLEKKLGSLSEEEINKLKDERCKKCPDNPEKN